MTEQTEQNPVPNSAHEVPTRLGNMPISFFAVVMGLGGLTLAWQKAEHLLFIPIEASIWLSIVSGAVFVMLVGFYGAKTVLHRPHVIKELNHPVRLSFFPAITISMLLLSVTTLHTQPDLARVLWIVGAAAHLALTLYVLGEWINQSHFNINHMNPAWFIPVVGNIVAPIAGVELGYVDASWFFFSIGLVFWVVLMAIVFYRIIFHNPLPDKLAPTLFILIAPPAVGFISYLKLTGDLDPFARILYFSALFTTLLLFTQLAKFARLKFFLSWWAYSFPLAAMTIATLVMYEKVGQVWYEYFAMALFGILNLVLALLIVRTIEAMLRGQICVEED